MSENRFWAREQQAAFEAMAREEQLDPVKLQAVLGNYLFTERPPLREEVIDMLDVKPRILERKAIYERVVSKVLGFVDTFVNGMGRGGSSLSHKLGSCFF